MRGLLRLRAYTADPEAVASYGPLTDESGARAFEMDLLPGGIARVAGVADRDAAARLTGTRLYVAREALPPAGEDEWYVADLVGLRAEPVEGTHGPSGVVVAAEDHGAGTVLTVREDGTGRDRDLPFTRLCVPVVDVPGGRLAVAWPEETAVPPRPARGEDGDGAGGGEEDAA